MSGQNASAAALKVEIHEVDTTLNAKATLSGAAKEEISKRSG